MLIGNGHKRIAFFTVSIHNRPTSSERYKGHIEALLQNGIAPKSEYLIEVDPFSNRDYAKETYEESFFSFHESAAKKALTQIISLKTPPTAIICCNDWFATHIQREAAKMNISVPETLSVTGFDNLDICNYMNVPITSVKQNFREIGKKAVELIIQMNKGLEVKDNYAYPGTIYRRQSVLNLKELPKKAGGCE
jgi:DNA-binding LacI/PurR family transcriptional regulator